MKKRIIKWAMLPAYAVPYAFLGIYCDAAFRTMAGYLPMLVGLGALCCIAAKTRNIPMLLLGNMCSFAASYTGMMCCGTERWIPYIKPFSPAGLLILVTAAALLAQAAAAAALWKREPDAFS